MAERVDCLVVKEFHKRGIEGHGVEIFETPLKLYCSDLLEKGNVKQSSLLKIDHPDNSFNLIMSTDVFEHAPENDIPQAIRELKRISRGAFLIVVGMNEKGSRTLHDGLKPI